MKSSVASLALLVATVTASQLFHHIHRHHNAHKRDIMILTETEYVEETQIAYATAWVYQDGSPVSSMPAVQPHAVPSEIPVPSAHSAKFSFHRSPPPQQTHYSAPATPAQAPKAPKASHVAAPPAPPASPPIAPHIAPSSALAPASSGIFTGQMTYYDVGLGSCGYTSTPSEHIVAIPVSQMNNPANPNANPLCGKSVTIHYGGKTATAKIVDTCMGCQSGDLDMSTSLFSYFAPMAEGRLGGMTWSLGD